MARPRLTPEEREQRKQMKRAYMRDYMKTYRRKYPDRVRETNWKYWTKRIETRKKQNGEN